MNKTKKEFSWRAFISFGLFFSFTIIFVTGIVLYIAPAGRIARWGNWELFGFSKADWESIHTVFSYVFAILSILHLFSINWKVFLSYLKNQAHKGLIKKKELFFSSIFTAFILIGIVFSIPPISTVMTFGNHLSESWENKETEPPIPNAELLTLVELSEQSASMSIEDIIHKLNINNIKFNSTNDNLAEIGILNKISPRDIYKLII